MIVGHRGMCSQYPQNTILSFVEAFKVVHAVELDVQITKDQEVIVFHDYFFSDITNVSQIPIFKDRKKEREFKGKMRQDWWVEDFTFQEIRLLEVKQIRGKNRKKLQGKFKIPLLKELLQIIQQNNLLLIQLKQQQNNYNKALATNLLKILNKHKTPQKNVILQSFNRSVLKQLQQQSNKLGVYYNRIQLIDNQQKIQLQDVIGYNVHASFIFKEGQWTQFIKKMHMKGKKVGIWTIIDDDQEIPFGKNNYKDVYLALKDQGIDYIITDFPQNAKAYFQQTLHQLH